MDKEYFETEMLDYLRTIAIALEHIAKHLEENK